MNTSVRARHAVRGFSLVELLVTIVLAGIIFAAMVPVFVSALKKSSADGLRVTATNIAQDRIEQVRLLSYQVISDSNLNNPPSPASEFGDGRFGPIITPAGSSKSYHIIYTVVDGTKHKKVTVQVRWSDTDYVTTMNTIIVDPTAAVVAVISGTPIPTPDPTATTGPFKITVSFKDYRHVKTSGTPRGVYVTRISPTPQVRIGSILYPSAGSPKVVWTGVPGGLGITYTVTCASKYGTFTTPPFHLLSDCPIHFDTHPGY